MRLLVRNDARTLGRIEHGWTRTECSGCCEGAAVAFALVDIAAAELLARERVDLTRATAGLSGGGLLPAGDGHTFAQARVQNGIFRALQLRQRAAVAFAESRPHSTSLPIATRGTTWRAGARCAPELGLPRRARLGVTRTLERVEQLPGVAIGLCFRTAGTRPWPVDIPTGVEKPPEALGFGGEATAGALGLSTPIWGGPLLTGLCIALALDGVQHTSRGAQQIAAVAALAVPPTPGFDRVAGRVIRAHFLHACVLGVELLAHCRLHRDAGAGEGVERRAWRAALRGLCAAVANAGGCRVEALGCGAPRARSGGALFGNTVVRRARHWIASALGGVEHCAGRTLAREKTAALARLACPHALSKGSLRRRVELAWAVGTLGLGLPEFAGSRDALAFSSVKICAGGTLVGGNAAAGAAPLGGSGGLLPNTFACELRGIGASLVRTLLV